MTLSSRIANSCFKLLISRSYFFIKSLISSTLILGVGLVGSSWPSSNCSMLFNVNYILYKEFYYIFYLNIFNINFK